MPQHLFHLHYDKKCFILHLPVVLIGNSSFILQLFDCYLKLEFGIVSCSGYFKIEIVYTIRSKPLFAFVMFPLMNLLYCRFLKERVEKLC